MDDKAIRLLEEIRDSHREHLELYRGALLNQEASIRMQAEAVAMQRRAMTRIIPAIVLLIVAISLLFALMGRW